MEIIKYLASSPSVFTARIITHFYIGVTKPSSVQLIPNDDIGN